MDKRARARQRVQISFVKDQPISYIYGMDKEISNKNFPERGLSTIEYGNKSYANILVYGRKLSEKEIKLFNLEYVGVYDQIRRKYVQEGLID